MPTETWIYYFPLPTLFTKKNKELLFKDKNIPRILLSKDQGGMLGLSIAKVIQLADINTRITKSNQPYNKEA